MTKPISICVTGPESSGKSTLSSEVSALMEIPLVKEYAREYFSLKKSNSYDSNSLLEIAIEQLLQIRNVQDSGLSVISDSGVEVVYIWHKEKFGISPEIKSLLSKQDFDLYLLCSPDIPWESDPLRENPKDRDRLFSEYEELAKNLGWRYAVVKGDKKERLDFSLQKIQSIKKSL